MYRRRILCTLYGAVDFLIVPYKGPRRLPPPPAHTARGGMSIGRGGPETHVHKITNVHAFYMELVLNDFKLANKQQVH
jgi:hypothetical protein